ncbi:MAG: hypothetical protein ABJ308_09765 [Halieaceae bacterium]
MTVKIDTTVLPIPHGVRANTTERYARLSLVLRPFAGDSTMYSNYPVDLTDWPTSISQLLGQLTIKYQEDKPGIPLADCLFPSPKYPFDEQPYLQGAPSTGDQRFSFAALQNRLTGDGSRLYQKLAENAGDFASIRKALNDTQKIQTSKTLSAGVPFYDQLVQVHKTSIVATLVERIHVARAYLDAISSFATTELNRAPTDLDDEMNRLLDIAVSDRRPAGMDDDLTETTSDLSPSGTDIAIHPLSRAAIFSEGSDVSALDTYRTSTVKAVEDVYVSIQSLNDAYRDMYHKSVAAADATSPAQKPESQESSRLAVELIQLTAKEIVERFNTAFSKLVNELSANGSAGSQVSAGLQGAVSDYSQAAQSASNELEKVAEQLRDAMAMTRLATRPDYDLRYLPSDDKSNGEHPQPEDIDAPLKWLETLYTYPRLACYLGFIVDVDIPMSKFDLDIKQGWNGWTWVERGGQAGTTPKLRTRTKLGAQDEFFPVSKYTATHGEGCEVVDGFLNLSQQIRLDPGDRTKLRNRYELISLATDKAVESSCNNVSSINARNAFAERAEESRDSQALLQTEGLGLIDYARLRRAKDEQAQAKIDEQNAKKREFVDLYLESVVDGFEVDACLVKKDESFLTRSLVRREMRFDAKISGFDFDAETKGWARELDQGQLRVASRQITDRKKSGEVANQEAAVRETMLNWRNASLALPVTPHAARLQENDPSISVAVSPMAGDNPEDRLLPLRKGRSYGMFLRPKLMNGRCLLSYDQAYSKYYQLASSNNGNAKKFLQRVGTPELKDGSGFLFQRHEPIASPEVVLTEDYLNNGLDDHYGEQIDRLVIRHEPSSDPDLDDSKRFLIIPRVSEEFSEMSGTFDDDFLKRQGDYRYAYKTRLGQLPGVGVGDERTESYLRIMPKIDDDKIFEKYFADPCAESLNWRFYYLDGKYISGSAGSLSVAGKQRKPVKLVMRRAKKDQDEIVMLSHREKGKQHELKVSLLPGKQVKAELWFSPASLESVGKLRSVSALAEFSSFVQKANSSSRNISLYNEVFDNWKNASKQIDTLKRKPIKGISERRVLGLRSMVKTPQDQAKIRQSVQGNQIAAVRLPSMSDDPSTYSEQLWADVIDANKGKAYSEWESQPNATRAYIAGELDFSRDSTDTVRILGSWEEYDSQTSVVREFGKDRFIFNRTEITGRLLCNLENLEYIEGSSTLKLEKLDSGGLRVLSVDLGDTKSRDIRLSTIASSRYRKGYPEYQSDKSRFDSVWPDASHAGIDLELPATNAPSPVTVEQTIPVYEVVHGAGWSFDGGKISKTITNRAHTRIYLGSSWFSQGREKVAIVFAPDGVYDPSYKDLVTLGGRDPKFDTDGIHLALNPSELEVTGSPRDVQTISDAGFDALAAIGAGIVVEEDLADQSVSGDSSSKRARLLTQFPTIDQESGELYCDFSLSDNKSYFPFVHLKLARYLPSAIPGHRVSNVAAKYIKVAPSREILISLTQDPRDASKADVMVKVLGQENYSATRNALTGDEAKLTQYPSMTVQVFRAMDRDPEDLLDVDVVAWPPALGPENEPMEQRDVKPVSGRWQFDKFSLDWNDLRMDRVKILVTEREHYAADDDSKGFGSTRVSRVTSAVTVGFSDLAHDLIPSK